MPISLNAFSMGVFPVTETKTHTWQVQACLDAIFAAKARRIDAEAAARATRAEAEEHNSPPEDGPKG